MRDDLGREGRELREEGCCQALAVCLLVGLKTTCVEIIQCVDGACRAILISTGEPELRPGSQRLGAKPVDRMTRAESGEHPESKNEAPNGAKCKF